MEREVRGRDIKEEEEVCHREEWRKRNRKSKIESKWEKKWREL